MKKLIYLMIGMFIGTFLAELTIDVMFDDGNYIGAFKAWFYLCAGAVIHYFIGED